MKSNEFENLGRKSKSIPLRSISHLGLVEPTGILTPERATQVLNILNTYDEYQENFIEENITAPIKLQLSIH